MNNSRIRQLLLITSILVGLGFVGLGRAMVVYGQTDNETGNVCVEFYGGNNCVANDVRIEALTPVNVIEACNEGTVGELEVVFQALISADSSPDRYDVATYIDLSGEPNGAYSGTMCLHTSLAPPLLTTVPYGDANGDMISDTVDGPWWDGDTNSCGDIESGTQVLVTLPSIRMPCVDNSGDPAGTADVHVCTSWRQNGGSSCSGVSQAIPGTGSKCNCTYIEYGFTPTFIEMVELNEMPQDNNSALIVSMLAAISLGFVTIVVIGRHKRFTNK